MSGRDCKSVAKRRAIWKFFGVEAGVSKVPQGEKTRLARLECLEERALLAVLADAAVEQSEWATHNESALEIPAFADAQESGVATFAVIGFGTGTTTAVAESLAVADAESAKLPGVPSGLQLENFNAETKTATLRWDAVADATECEVELSLDAGATWSPVGSVSGDANEIALTNLPDAAVVRCRARATNGALTSIWANAAFAVGEIETNGTRETAVALGDLTGCAQNLTQTAGGEYGEDWFSFEIPSVGAADDRLTLSYEHDYSKHYLNFELYNAEGTRLTSATGSTGEKSISLKNRAAGTYYVRVYPYRGGATQYSLTVETAATAPDAPTHLRVDALNTAKKTAVLTWDDVDGETGYVVESSLDGTTWTTLGIAEANATTFDVSDAAAGVKYRARAVGEFEYSNWTETSLTGGNDGARRRRRERRRSFVPRSARVGGSRRDRRV